MPPIRLRTADPLLVVLRARTLLSERGSAVKGPALEALACATGNYLGSVSFERHPPVPIPPLLAVPSACQQKPSALICTKRNINRARGSLTTSATSNAKPLLSSKRQRSALPAESPSSKRSRRVRPSIPVRRNPPRAAKSKTVCLPHARGPR
ncbi:hypothetical protein CYLTODRAFT_166370 [Cylindrobasidium torrendii FP15055 ss-10]|uniref:Uncharacterized protein n=1 Tax=Cylindrobasidium torrendii FP15055 ss-10 TaxID=1314674 RepID=A0A0D7AX09_9AGAR|nr:hypothetical protein CYLTODRAFT_166370 [Cylindrobasidium torrendii FP15055 ss-10]